MPSRTTARRVTSRAARLPDGAVRHRVRLGAGTDVHVIEWPATPAATGTPAEGVTVVLAHGWTLTHESWLPVVERLRSRFGVRVVAFDQPGHGLSGAESQAPTVHELGEVLHRVLLAVAPSGPIVLAGHSMGGMTIMAWAADHAAELADRVRGVAFVATSAKVGEDRRVRLPLERAVMRASARAPRVAPGRLLSTRSQTRLLYGRETAPETVVPGVTLIRHTSLPTLGRYFLALQEHDETEALAHLGAVPTRVLVGTADRLTPVRDAWALTNGIRGARLTVLPGLGHMLTYEAPDAVAGAIGELLTRG